jgi:hypothetical protein
MKFTKSILLVAGFLASTTAFSAPNPAAFSAHQATVIAMIQGRIQIEQQHLTCAQAATDQAALKACHETAKQAHQALAAQIKAQNPAAASALPAALPTAQ